MQRTRDFRIANTREESGKTGCREYRGILQQILLIWCDDNKLNMISYIVYDTYGISFHKLSSLGCSNLVEIQNTKVVLTRIIDIYEGIFIPSYHI